MKIKKTSRLFASGPRAQLTPYATGRMQDRANSAKLLGKEGHLVTFANLLSDVGVHNPLAQKELIGAYLDARAEALEIPLANARDVIINAFLTQHRLIHRGGMRLREGIERFRKALERELSDSVNCDHPASGFIFGLSNLQK